MFGKTKINDPCNTMGDGSRVKGCGRLVKKYDLSPGKPAAKTRTCPDCDGEGAEYGLLPPSGANSGTGGMTHNSRVMRAECGRCRGTGQVPA